MGKRFQMRGRWIRVIGLVKAAKYQSLTERQKPFFYVPLRQSRLGSNVLIRASLPPQEISRLLIGELHSLDRNLSPGEVLGMREQVDRMTWTQRAAMKLLAIFGGLALLLGAVGLYGVMSYSVSQRKRELGLRMALGARASDLLRSVIAEGLLLTGVGVALGAGAALLLTRLLGDLLYRTSPRDPRAFEIAVVVIALVSLAASLVPAWRASRTDPVRALRDSA